MRCFKLFPLEKNKQIDFNFAKDFIYTNGPLFYYSNSEYSASLSYR